jgi:hypothetical protein
MKKNVASQIVGCQLVSKTDGSPVTSGTTTVYVTGDGGTQATGSVGSGACTHEGHGFWTYAPAQAETNYDHVAFTFENSTAVNATVQIYPSFPQTGDNFARIGSNGSGLTALASQTSVDDLPTSAELATALGTADDAVLSAIAALNNISAAQVNSEVDTAIADAALATAANLSTVAGYLDTEIAAILADTNELQTDWANGGRLDLILDARASQTSVDDLPTNSELTTALASADDAVLAAVATVDGNVDSIKATTDKLDDTLEDDAGTYRFTTNALEQAPSGSGASAADIADAVWDEATADHQTAGTTGKAVTDAQSAGDPWESTLEGSYTASDLLRIVAAVAAGKTSIAGTTVTFRDVTDSSDIVEGSMTDSERTSVTITP